MMPAWWASRLTPLAALNAYGNEPTGSRLPWQTALIGMLLILIDPFLFFGPVENIAEKFGAADPVETARNIQYYGHFLSGVPGIVLGFFLLSPMLVWIIEHAAAPILSRITGPARQACSASKWAPACARRGNRIRTHGRTCNI